MTWSFLRRPTPIFIGLAIGLTTAVVATGATLAGEPLSVVLDQARILKMPANVQTLVVGNPLIADVSVQAGGVLVVTGKGYGLTNLIAMDRGGKVLMEEVVQVSGPVDSVVVYRGASRESYSCTPFCERRITLGDTPEFFNANLVQTNTRNSGAQASGHNTPAMGPR
jgi:hypothetical protein